MVDQDSPKQTWIDPKLVVFGDVAEHTQKQISLLSDGVIRGPGGFPIFPNNMT